MVFLRILCCGFIINFKKWCIIKVRIKMSELERERVKMEKEKRESKK